MVPGFLAEFPVYQSEAVRNNQKLCFFTAASAFKMQHDMGDSRQQARPFPAGVVSLVSGEVKHVAPNSLDFGSCFMPIGARLDHGPGKGITHDL